MAYELIERTQIDIPKSELLSRLKGIRILSDSLEAFLGKTIVMVVEYEKLETYSQYRATGKLVKPRSEVACNALLKAENRFRLSRFDSVQLRINQTRHQFVNQLIGLPTMSDSSLVKFEDQLSLRATDRPNHTNPKRRKWSESTFRDIPMGAGVALLTMHQNNTRNAEVKVLEQFIDIIRSE